MRENGSFVEGVDLITLPDLYMPSNLTKSYFYGIIRCFGLWNFSQAKCYYQAVSRKLTIYAKFWQFRLARKNRKSSNFLCFVFIRKF